MTDTTFFTTRVDDLEQGALWDAVFAGDVDQTCEVLRQIREAASQADISFGPEQFLRRVGATPEFEAQVLAAFS